VYVEHVGLRVKELVEGESKVLDGI
jgi:hypothetical protein